MFATAFLAYNSLPAITSALQAKTPGELFSGLVDALSTALIAFLGAILVMWVMGFFFSALWMYYAMDRNGFFDSLSKSFSLVSSNILEFLIVGIIFGLLMLGGWALAVACCCFAWVISPVLDVFLTVLYGITLMKMKLALEKK
ncbi:TPA: hypothetical protein HA243_04755 [Candidatus Micrarchaeota archaeon]|nr:hypothetical protein [Candidatus Micrarchaeota archaeon]